MTPDQVTANRPFQHCRDWLGYRLADGPAVAADVAHEAAAAGYTRTELADALKSLGVRRRRGRFQLDGWDVGYWKQFWETYDRCVAEREREVERMCKQAAREMTERCMTIINSLHAEDRPKLALHLACKTDVSVELAHEILRAAPADGSFSRRRT